MKTLKRKVSGFVEKLKARLAVTRRFTQEEGTDFRYTYNPVVKITIMRTILVLAILFRWDIQQLDVRNAFLNRVLQETVYVKQPTRFIDKKRPKDVCLLHKAILVYEVANFFDGKRDLKIHTWCFLVFQNLKCI